MDDIEEKEVSPKAREEKEDNAQTLLTVIDLVKSHLASINRESKELIKMREMLEDALLGDANYRELNEKVKEAVKARTGAKSTILKRPEVATLNEKVKEIREKIAESRQSLSDYLQDYARLTGSNQIEDEEGDVNQIVYVAKLAKVGKAAGK